MALHPSILAFMLLCFVGEAWTIERERMLLIHSVCGFIVRKIIHEWNPTNFVFTSLKSSLLFSHAINTSCSSIERKWQTFLPFAFDSTFLLLFFPIAENTTVYTATWKLFRQLETLVGEQISADSSSHNLLRWIPRGVREASPASRVGKENIPSQNFWKILCSRLLLSRGEFFLLLSGMKDERS